MLAVNSKEIGEICCVQTATVSQMHKTCIKIAVKQRHINQPERTYHGLRAGVRREGVCCGQEWMMAMKDEAGCVDFREVGRILCLSVMVHCNQHSDGRSGAAGARRRWRKEDAAAGRVERRWLWRNSGAEDGIMVDRLLRKKLLEGERGRI